MKQLVEPHQKNTVPLVQRAADLQPSLPILPKRRLEFLKMVFKFYVEHGNFPTTIEIAKTMKLKSRQGALQYIKALIKEDCLTRDASSKSRYVRFTDIGLNVLFSSGINVTASVSEKMLITIEPIKNS